jgi:endonuclease/exonuclease/phosphatase family metal-dependent hydrolase
MHKFLHRTLVIICTLLAAGLLLSYLSVYINPERFWFLALIGLSYPFLLIGNLLFLIYWTIRWKRAFLIPLLAILIGVSHLTNFIQLPFGKKAESIKSDIKILSYNVNLFRLYAWSKETPTFNKITDFAKTANVDVACFQEFYVVDERFTENMACRLLNMNAHIEYVIKNSKSGYGIATFSKFPIVNNGVIKFDNTSNACIYSDIKIGYDTVRVYNCHLQSLRLKERNLNFLIKQDHQEESNTVAELKDISFKFRDALKKRAHQVNTITTSIKTCKYKVIICGDFNDSPFSYSYHELTRDLNDTFKEAGKGLANTYVRFFPYRIDYILHSKDIKAITFSSPRVNYSDHYPVIASFIFKE